MTRILITGASGLLGPTLVGAAEEYGEVMTVSRSVGDMQCDLVDRQRVESVVKELEPDWILHAAGLTNVDLCENNPGKAYRNNTIATKNLVGAIPKNTRLLYISTDQVYPDTLGPHKESEVGPVNVYGRSKLLAEKAVLSCSNSIVARVNFFGQSSTIGRHSLDDFIIDRLSMGRDLALFSDIYFSPLHMSTLGRILLELVYKKATGTYNVGSREGMSKATFGYAVADVMSLPIQTASTVKSTSLSTRAPRPGDLRMDVTKIERLLGERMPLLISEVEKIR